jgi:D-beta-D-heptose 7-phosphate kinase/D-beta-D-heptose 1-phosphate adenosyltransferase
MLDRYVYGRAERLSPEAPVPVLLIEREEDLPGGAANVVRNLTALGAAAAFISVVGNDAAGAELTGLIGQETRIEPWLLVEEGRRTTRKTRYIAGHHHLLRADREQATPLGQEVGRKLVKIARNAILATSLTVLSDYGKGVLLDGLAGDLIALARELDRRVLVDPSNGDLARFSGADVILPTASEIALATGLPVQRDNELVTASRVLAERYGFGAVLALRGVRGVSLVTKEGEVAHFPFPEAELDLFGVTDAVLASLAIALAAGLDLKEAAAIAARAATLAALRPGRFLIEAEALYAALTSP